MKLPHGRPPNANGAAGQDDDAVVQGAKQGWIQLD